MIWGKLAEDVSLLCGDEHPIFNRVLDTANTASMNMAPMNIAPFIRNAASQYLLLSDLELPQNSLTFTRAQIAASSPSAAGSG